MIAHAISFSIRNLPVFLLIPALVVGLLRYRDEPLAERLLSWVLLLPIGITGITYGSFISVM